MAMLSITKTVSLSNFVQEYLFRKFLEDFQGNLIKQSLSIIGVPEEYSKYSKETPVIKWICFGVFPTSPIQTSSQNRLISSRESSHI